MLKLKEVLASLGKPQTDLARAVDLSPAAIAQLINHSQWPKSLDQQQLAWRITEYLMAQGAQFDTVRQAFDEVGPRRSNVGAPATPEDAQENEECEPMLMRKQVLLPATKKAFDIRRDPFDELHSADDIFINADIRYVREAMHQVAMHDGFLAVIGESGAGKSTLRRDLEHRLEGSPVTVIQPYVLGMEDNDTKGKPLKSEHIAEAILAEIAPDQTPRNSSQARWAQLHKALKASHTAGSRHLLIIEEAHSLSTPTIKHLKRYRELELGYTKLVSIILIGQPELLIKLSPRNGEVREVHRDRRVAAAHGRRAGTAPGVSFRAGWQGTERCDRCIRPAGRHREAGGRQGKQAQPALSAGHRQPGEGRYELCRARRRAARHC